MPSKTVRARGLARSPREVLTSACLETLEQRINFGDGWNVGPAVPTPSPDANSCPPPVVDGSGSGTGNEGGGKNGGGDKSESGPGGGNQQHATATSSVAANSTQAPILASSGVPVVNAVDLQSDAFGKTWTQGRTWIGTNDASLNGNGWANTSLPYLLLTRNQFTSNHGAIVDLIQAGGSSESWSTTDTGTTFTPRGSNRNQLRYIPATTVAGVKLPGMFEITDTSGATTRFNDLPRRDNGDGDTLTDGSGNKYRQLTSQRGYPLFTTNWWTDPSTGATSSTATNKYSIGSFVSWTSASGQSTAKAAYDSTTGLLSDIVRTDGSGAYERFHHTYNTWTNSVTSASVTLISEVFLQKGSSDSGPWTTIRSAAYDYYTGAGSDSLDGRLGDLKLVTIKDYLRTPSTPAVIDQSYYRYYKFHTYSYYNVYSGSDKMTASNDSLSGGTGGTDDQDGVDTAFAATGSDNAVMSGLKTVVTGANFARLAANYSSYASVPDVDTSLTTDANGDGNPKNDDLRSYANNYFRYERYSTSTTEATDVSMSRYRVIYETAASQGCSLCSGGFGEFKYTYTASAANKSDPYDFVPGIAANTWVMKLTEYLPDATNADTNGDGYIDSNQWNDNDTEVFYTNEVGQVMLSNLTDKHNGPTNTPTYYHYDSADRLDFIAHSSAIRTFYEGRNDLVDFSNSSSPYILHNQGLIEHFLTPESTSDSGFVAATSSTPGDLVGFQKSYSVRHGLLGSDVTVSSQKYLVHTYNGIDVHPIATTTSYFDVNNDGVDDAQTTTQTYLQWQGNIPTSIQTSVPAVSTSRNGSGSSSSSTTVFDTMGRPIWMKDEDGFITYTQYDSGTGAVIKQITDVNTSGSGFTGLPSGWTTPSGGGLHLTTTMQVDGLGREIKRTDPKGNITYTVYIDSNHESRTYRGWTGTTTTGPIEINRQYWPASGASAGQRVAYYETLTSSATPFTTSGVPNGNETLDTSNIQTLDRTLTNDAGQRIEGDHYFSLAGLTYSLANATLGTASNDSSTGNYHRTNTDYDSRNRVKRIVSPTGTITRNLYDTRGNVLSTWVGTDDSPTSGYWSPTNTAGTNLTKVSENEYDYGVPGGDGNLTSTTAIPGGSAAPRATQMFYDWRDRLTISKEGAQTTESADTQRTVTAYTYDNQNRVTSVSKYDGDNTLMTPPFTATISNPGFESPYFSSSTYSYVHPTDWSANEAYVYNGMEDSVFPVTPTQGSQVAALSTSVTEEGNYSTQTIPYPTGYEYHPYLAQSFGVGSSAVTAVVSFDAANFATYDTNFVDVLVDGNVVAVIAPHDGPTMTHYVSSAISLAAGSHILAFASQGYNCDTFLDNVQILPSQMPPLNSSTGAPDLPSASLLRAKTTYSYDELGRQYRQSTFSVDPSSGTVSTNALKSDTFYDNRGNVIKTSAPGGLVTKNAYDGAGRVTSTYQADGGGDSGWSDAGNVTGDAVLEQNDYVYDADGNVIMQTNRQRFDDDTHTGALGGPQSGGSTPKARVSYVDSYYDAADRMTDSVNLGTAGGLLLGNNSFETPTV